MVINKSCGLEADDEITIIMSDGKITGRVTEIQKENS